MTHRIFVYGTLKRGLAKHDFLTDTAGSQVYRGQATTVDRWPLVVSTKYSIPCLLDVRGVGKNVRGEVYAIDDVKLEVLDRLEDHPRHYERVPIKVNFITDSEDRSIQNPSDPQDIEVYILRKPSAALLDLKMLENYDPDSGEYSACTLSQEQRMDKTIWRGIGKESKESD